MRALLELARLSARGGQNAVAAEILERALELAPNSEEVLAARAKVSLAVQTPVVAIRALESLTRMHPTAPEYHYLLGVARLQIGEMAGSVEALQLSLELEPGRPLALIALGTTLNAQKRFAEAREVARRAVRLDPESAEALADLAEAEEGLGEIEAAEEHANQALARAPEHAQALATIGRIRMTQERYEEARDAFLRAVASEPHSAKTHYQLSLAFARLGDRESSRKHLELYRRIRRESDERLVELRTRAGLGTREWGGHESSLLASTVILAGLLSAGATRSQEAAAAPPHPFRDVAQEAGITFRQSSAPEKKYILESMPGGLALLDYNNDDLLDIYFVDALTVEGAADPKAARSALYKNLGDMRFVDVSEEAGVAFPAGAWEPASRDVDGDNWQDLFVTTVGNDRLYRNRGDGTFEDITEKAGIVTGGWSTGCGFADYDRDGDLDLFVSRYVQVDLDNLPEFGKGKFCVFRGVEVQCGPRGLPGTGDLFFRNDGQGRFEEIGEEVGVSDPEKYFGLGVSWVDVNSDGWLDLFVANDAGPNFLYRNKQDGTFEEDAFPAGVAVSEDGSEQGCMGVAVGDYRNEGRFSIFVSNFSEEYNVLYKNGGDYFTDESFRSASASASMPFVGWGTTFFDYDNDGWMDLVVVNGHVYPQMANVKRAGRPGTSSASCSTATGATALSRRSVSSSGPCSPITGSAAGWFSATWTTTADSIW